MDAPADPIPTPRVSEPTGFAPTGRRPLPWWRITRAVGIALDPRKLILAALGLMMLALGWWAIDLAFLGSRVAFRPPVSPRLVPDEPGIEPWILGLGSAVAEPALILTAPFESLFAPKTSTADFLRALLRAVWAVLIWAPIGGAIARIAIVDLAGGERPGVIGALRFALGRARALIGAPLSPLIGLAFFGALSALVGLIYWIPGPTGPILGGVFAFLPLLAGLVMALILIGLAVGWPLMILTVAAEGEDAFDALSRSYSYTYQRPWLYALLASLAWAIGIVGLVVVRLLAGLVVRLAVWGLSLGGPDERILGLFAPCSDRVATSPAATIHGFWIGLVDLLAYGWVYAYFWAAAAVVYLLLRYDVDGALFEDVYRPHHDRDRFAPEGSTDSTDGPEKPAATIDGPAGPGPEGEGPP